MAKKTSEDEPALEPEAESSAEELSEAELERKRRQEMRREAKRQKEELRRIEKEVRGPMSKWAKIAIGVILLLMVAVSVVGWLVYCSYSVSLQRDSFTEEYNRADLARLRQFAPTQLDTVEQLKQQAENRDGSLNWQEVVTRYREAEEALAQAGAAATANSGAYDAALVRFRVLKEEAAKNHLDQYAKGTWARVLEAEASATAEPSQEFSVALATDKLKQVVELLEKASATYPALREFDTLSTELRRLRHSVEETEWEHNVPEAWSTLQGQTKLLETAQEALDWTGATTHGREAMATIAPALEKIASLKAQAADAISVMEQAIKTAEAAAMPAAKPDVWAKATAAAKSAREAMAASDYAGAVKVAQDANGLLGEAGESVRQARLSLKDTLAQVKALYEKAVADQAFFTQNSPDAWQAVQRKYQQIPEFYRQNKTFELVALCTDLRQQLEAMAQERDAVFADSRNAEARLEAIAKLPLYAHLQRNYAEAFDKTDELRRTAMRRRDRGELREARDLLVQCADQMEGLMKDLDGVRSGVLQLRTSLLDRRGRFQEGIRRFLGAQAEEVARSMTRLEQLLTSNLYVDAMAVAKGVDGVLPKNRLQPALPGTVIDYEKGLMWIADGATAAGGNEGKPLGWYEALRWADALLFAGFDDWRLPTEEELRDLARLAPADRDALLPNTAKGMHWSKIPSPDVELALAVNVDSATISRENKTKLLAVRAVRQPN